MDPMDATAIPVADPTDASAVLQTERRIRIGLTSRHHGAWPSIRHAASDALDFTDVGTLPMGTRLARWHPRLRNLWRSFAAVRRQPEIDLLHSYQKVLLTRQRWVVSHDALMPFYPRPYLTAASYRRIFARLAREECRAILPHSANAARQIASRNDGLPGLEQVMSKVTVVYPAVADGADLYQVCLSRQMDREIHLLFVGRQFFIKGGHLAVSAFRRLRRRYPLRMSVVSPLSTEDWTTHRPPALKTQWRAILDELGVAHYDSLPNEEVRRLMAASDILLLPSIDETFGFVLLEALATGLPVIATSVRAIPEIVRDGETGLLIPCELDGEGRLVRRGDHEGLIEEGLQAAIAAFADDLPRLEAAKRACRRDYLARFQVSRLAADLQRIYRVALA